MNKLVAGLSALALSLFAAPSYAVSQEVRNQHLELLQAVENAGISVLANVPKHCGKRTTYGMYHSAARAIIICQMQAGEMNGEPVTFNAEDLDTLRHEAHHLIQDCMDGRIDGDLELFMTKDEDKRVFYANFPASKMRQIAQNYRNMGASEHVVALEIEAFATAEQVPADIIGDVVTQVCGTR